MALVPMYGVYERRFNTATRAIHLVRIDADGTETDLGAIVDNATAIDSTNNALVGVTDGHYHIHMGDSFTISVGQMVSDTNDRTAVAIKTPSGTVRLHVVATAISSAASWFYIRRGPTVVDNQGATLEVFNRDDNSGNTTGVIDTSQNPDAAGAATYFAEADQGQYTENGTLMHSALMAGGVKSAFGGGGETRGLRERKLLPDTVYLFYIKSLTNDNNYHNLMLDWYEHTDL